MRNELNSLRARELKVHVVAVWELRKSFHRFLHWFKTLPSPNRNLFQARISGLGVDTSSCFDKEGLVDALVNALLQVTLHAISTIGKNKNSTEFLAASMRHGNLW